MPCLFGPRRYIVITIITIVVVVVVVIVSILILFSLLGIHIASCLYICMY